MDVRGAGDDPGDDLFAVLDEEEQQHERQHQRGDGLEQRSAGGGEPACERAALARQLLDPVGDEVLDGGLVVAEGALGEGEQVLQPGRHGRAELLDLRDEGGGEQGDDAGEGADAAEDDDEGGGGPREPTALQPARRRDAEGGQHEREDDRDRHEAQPHGRGQQHAEAEQHHEQAPGPRRAGREPARDPSDLRGGGWGWGLTAVGLTGHERALRCIGWRGPASLARGRLGHRAGPEGASAPLRPASARPDARRVPAGAGGRGRGRTPAGAPRAARNLRAVDSAVEKAPQVVDGAVHDRWTSALDHNMWCPYPREDPTGCASAPLDAGSGACEGPTRPVESVVGRHACSSTAGTANAGSICNQPHAEQHVMNRSHTDGGHDPQGSRRDRRDR